MRPKTSFETHRLAIQNKQRDAIAFVAIGAIDDARRVQFEIATMKFGGETPRETHHLLKEIDKAVAAIGALIACIET